MRTAAREPSDASTPSRNGHVIPLPRAGGPSESAESPSARRILYVEANEDGTVGGSHQALFDLARSLDRSRYTPVVLYYQHNRYVQSLTELGIETHVYEGVRADERAVHRSGKRAAKLWEMWSSIRRRAEFLRHHRIDLIHINNSPRVGNDDWLPAARLVGIPCIANVMGDASGDTGRVRRWLFRQFDHYLPISVYITEAMRGHGIPDERMSLIYLGVDLEAFRGRVNRSREEVRAELGVSEDMVLALMVGNIREWKGQHIVLAALQQLAPDRRARLHVAFAGAASQHDAEYQRHLESMVAQAGLEARVSFLGARQDIPNLLNAADIALHASVRPEPFGLVVVEAMALGTPIIAANTGGPAEIVTPQSGLTFDPRVPEQLEAALSGLVDDPQRLAALRVGALERAREFTVTRYVKHVQDVYATVLPSSPK